MYGFVVCGFVVCVDLQCVCGFVVCVDLQCVCGFEGISSLASSSETSKFDQ